MVNTRMLAALILGLILIAAACGAAPVEVAEMRSDDPVTTTVKPAEIEPEDRIAVASSAIGAVDTFRFTVRAEATADSDLLPFDRFVMAAAGAIDVAGDRSQLRIEYEEGLSPNDDWDVPNFTEEIRIGDTRYERGYNIVTALDSDADADAWYLAADDGYGADPLLAGLVDGALVGDLVAASESVEEIGSEEINGVAVTHLKASVTRPRLTEVGAAHPGSIADFDLDIPGPPARFEMWIDDEGLTHRLTFSVDDAFEGLTTYYVEIELSGFGEIVDIVVPDTVLDMPRYSDDTYVDPRTEIRAEEDGTMFRLNIHKGQAVTQLTVEESGRVVVVTDTSILATPDSYTTWRISTDAVAQLVAMIESSGLLDHPLANLQFGPDTDGLENSAAIFYNDCCIVDMDGLGRRDGFTDEELTSRLAFEEIVEQLRDLRWLGDEILTDPMPFVPDGMTVLASPAAGGRGPVLAWPLVEGIDALSTTVEDTGTASNGRPVCLYGEDAAAVFALTERQGTSLTIDDGTAVWDVFIRSHLPGYRLYGDPCM